MIPHAPADGFHDADFAGSIGHLGTLAREVPHAGAGSDDELLHADEEGDDPEESEEEGPHDAFSLLCPFNVSNHRVWSEFCFSHAPDVNSSVDPNEENDHRKEVSNNWKDHDSNVARDEFRSGLHDACTQ